MADIEDRITKHSHAFEGLLLLVPASEKRKLTKSEKRKEAKQGKPGHEAVKIDKGKVIRVGKKEDRRESEKSVGVATIVDGEKRRQAKKQQKQKPKSSSKQQGKAHNETSITEAEFGDVDDDTETKRVEKKKLVSKTPPQKKTKMEASIQTKEPSQKPHKPSGPLSRAIPKIPINLSTESALESSLDSTISLSPSITSTTPDPQSNSTETLAQDPAPKSEVSPEERSNARARLAAHIASLRSKRKADGTAANSRHALLETRQKKEAARKERKKSLRLASKLTEGPSPTADTPSLIRPPPIEVDSKPKNDFLFGAVTFDDGQELDHTLADFKKTRKRKGPTDVMGQLKHVEAKKARLENMDPEKAGRIYEKEMWGRALKQTVGEKVRDDEKLLKKALKRQQGEKRKSEREWKERKGSVAKGIAIRQKKREENINARKEQKKLGKAGKKVKTSGKKKMQKTKKGGSKPGFEGRMKSGKPAGKSGGGGGGWKRLEK